MARARNVQNPFVTLISSPVFHLVSSSPLTYLLFSPRKSPTSHTKFLFPSPPFFFLLTLISFTFLGIFILAFLPFNRDSIPCNFISPSSQLQFPSKPHPELVFASLSSQFSSANGNPDLGLRDSVILPLPPQRIGSNFSTEESEFWKQPDGEGYKPCLDFSFEYRKASASISKEKKRFLVVVTSGGLNQQRSQIVDAVVIARILRAALVLPVLQVNLIWGDESEFSDIFDAEHFKRVLRADVRIVSSLPSTHLMSRQSVENQIPMDISPLWLRAKFSRRLNEEGLLVLKGLASKLSKNLPPDLQKLRCKVAFHALRFAAPVQELGDRLARRMWIEGPYVALHLRLEKDVWVRSGCLTGLGHEFDKVIAQIRESQTEYLTGRLNMSYNERRLAGLCPLNAAEMARLLKALGVSSNARIYIAGGEPFGGIQALHPLMSEFQNLVTRDMLAKEGEIAPFVNKSSALAAIDFIVSLSSNVFIPSHGGNMGRLLQGHRAYAGHLKCIKPNKRAMIPFFEDSSLSDSEFGSIVRMLHRNSRGQPEPRNKKRDRDVIAYPVPECMCKNPTPIF